MTQQPPVLRSVRHRQARTLHTAICSAWRAGTETRPKHPSEAVQVTLTLTEGTLHLILHLLDAIAWPAEHPITPDN
jgi:hypothetical protein